MNRIDPTSPFGHKIRPRHLDRLAIIYVRQSTQQQVLGNRESADLQYQLQQRAVTLGWTNDRVMVIDDDQGISGSSAENRLGFQRLLAEVSLGHVGIVFGREMSRLARSCKDWHQLLELCGIFQVLLADADGVYDPADFNDRLLLGLKGTMSEAELHILRARLHQGKLNKASRGELFTCVPVGYVRTAEGGIALDPDEQVRSVVSLVFTKFAELGSLRKTHAYFVANNIQFGLRVYKGPGKGRLVWDTPRRSLLYEIIRNPTYAGAYTYGRCPLDPARRVAGKPKSGRHEVAPEQWLCLIRDRLPAYITWQQYEENRLRLSRNDRGGGSKTTTGRGPTLLNGIVRCGRCGTPMQARNARASANPRYACDRAFQELGRQTCQSLVAAFPDRLIESLILKAIEPASLELSLCAAEGAERDRERLHRHWKQRLERATYEATRARRQYHAVDPENRLVARELERLWEQSLAQTQRLEEEFARFQQDQPRHLSQTDRERIRTLAADLPRLWRSETTTGSDRRSIVRLLIDQVELTRRGTGQEIDMVIHWRGGSTTHHEVRQGLRTYRDLSGGTERLRDRILALRGDGLTGDQIAAILNREGFHPARGSGFSGNRVRRLLVQFGRSGVPPGVRDAADLPGREEHWLTDLAKQLGLRPIVVHRWRWSGWLHARQLRGENGRWIVWANPAERERLQRLRESEIQSQGRRRPAPELTTPSPRTDPDGSTTRS
jgi:DNA invertase Pin-like site-specific DNA recombinase